MKPWIRNLALSFSCIVGCAEPSPELASVDLSDPMLYSSIRNPSTPVYQPPQEPKRFTVMARLPSKAVWDIAMSPYAGGEDLLFAHRILEKIETYCFRQQPITYSKSAYSRFWRLSELISVWLPINYFTMLIQHEVFGHGYRIRDLHMRGIAQVDGYSFQAPPPYGPGSAATYFSVSSDFTTTDASAVSIGGVEGTAILAELTKLKWLTSRKVDPRQAVLYLLCEQDLTLYISSLKTKDIRNLDGHDLNSYIETLHYTYPDHWLSKGRLRSLSWINLLDPFTFYAIYAWFHYLSSGKETKIPMIASCYLPGLRLGLTPFGPEVFFENFFVRKKIPLYAYLKGGSHADNLYAGAGVFSPRLWSIWKWTIGLRCDLWYQPKLLLQKAGVSIEEIDFKQRPNRSAPLYSSSQRHAMHCGASGSCIAEYRWNEQCSYEIELGYKSAGFLPGYSLFSLPTARLAFMLVF